MKGTPLLLLLAACGSAEDEIRNAVRKHFNPSAPDGILDVIDLRPASATVNVPTGRGSLTFYLVKRGEWTVAYEAQEEFTKKNMHEEAFENAFLKRMGERMAERFKLTADIKPGLPKDITFAVAAKQLTARIETQYAARPETGISRTFRYVETHAFEDGKWTYQSNGLFDKQ